MIQILDSLGKSVNVGSVISYPVRKGSRMWMTHGRVESFKVARRGNQHRVEASVRPLSGAGKAHSFYSFDRCVAS